MQLSLKSLLPIYQKIFDNHKKILYNIYRKLRKGKNKNMNKEQKIALMKNRIATMEQNGKNVKAPGALRALKRELRNIEK